MKTFHLEIYTPYKKYYSDDVSFLHVRNSDTVLGILPNHAPLVTSIKIAEIIIKKDDKENVYACGGGVMDIQNNKVTLLLHSIERADEIDLERAIASKLRAEERLKDKLNSKIDIRRAELALSRALVRISIKNYTNK